MAASRKDFVAIAGALYRTPDELAFYALQKKTPAELHGFYCHSVADALRDANPSFDRARFLKACGVQS